MNRRQVVIAAVAGLLLAAAGGGYGRLYPRVPGHADAVAAAVFSAPRVVLAPAGPVPGLYPASVVERPVGDPDDRMALYAGPDGAVLAALYKPGSDSAGLPDRFDETTATVVNGHRAAVTERDGDVWVTWRVYFDDDQERDQYGVLGRGVSRSAVVDAARHLVTPRDREPRISDHGLPDGFAPVGVGAVSLGGNGAGVPGGTTLRWTDERAGGDLTLSAVGVDEVAAALVRAMVVDGRPAWTSAGPEIARAWVVDGTGYLASAHGLTDAQLDAVVAGLHPASPADLAAFAAQVDDYPLERLVRDGDTYVAGGRFRGGGSWMVSTTPGAKTQENTTVRLPGGADATGGSQGPGMSGPLSVSAYGAADGTTALVGRVEPPVVKVEVTGVEAPVALVPAADGGAASWFGVVVEPPGTATVVAYDRAGRELTRESR